MAISWDSESARHHSEDHKMVREVWFLRHCIIGVFNCACFCVFLLSITVCVGVCVGFLYYLAGLEGCFCLCGYLFNCASCTCVHYYVWIWADALNLNFFFSPSCPQESSSPPSLSVLLGWSPVIPGRRSVSQTLFSLAHPSARSFHTWRSGYEKTLFFFFSLDVFSVLLHLAYPIQLMKSFLTLRLPGTLDSYHTTCIFLQLVCLSI